jgi:hypothetical protein
MASLASVVKEVVFSYASGGLNLRTFALSNEEQGVYGVNVIDWPERRRPASVVVLARIEGEQIIIEEDSTDRPLVEALVMAGIPRERIVLHDAEPLIADQG